MRLSPKEIEKLMLHQAGFVAQKRYARGLKLNYPEAVALIATQLMEFIREGALVSELMEKGTEILALADVMQGVPALLDDVQVEATFPDGTKLVTVHQPIRYAHLDNGYALYGSGLVKMERTFAGKAYQQAKPGEVLVEAGSVELNVGRKTLILEVENTADRSVQVGSHYLFAETNKALKFDRMAAIGFRLDIPAGTAVRFAPHEKRAVQLVEIGGERKMFGANNLINGEAGPEQLVQIHEKMEREGYLETVS